MEIKLHKQYQKVFDSHWWFRVRANILSDVLKKYSHDNTTVLDYGCNYGNTVRELQAKGYDAIGMDISKEAIEYGNEIGIKNIYLNSEKDFQENSFDVAIALDVIEHIEDDRSAMEYLLSRVRPNGIVIVMVPAYKFLWTYHDEVAQHYRRYTKKMIKELVDDKNRYEFIKLSYFNTFLFPLITGVRFFTKLIGSQSRQSDFDLNNKFLNAIFYFIFDAERKLLRFVDYPFGVSLLAVIRKKQ